MSKHKHIYVLKFKPQYTPPVIVGHYLKIDDAVKDGIEFRSRYLAKIPYYVRPLAESFCRYWVEVKALGLNLDVTDRVVQPVQHPDDRRRMNEGEDSTQHSSEAAPNQASTAEGRTRANR